MAETLDETSIYLGNEPLDPELESQIDAALEAARHAPPAPSVRAIEYLPGIRILLMHMKNGQRIPLPVEDVEELAHATDEQLSHFVIEGGGLMVHFPDFDGNLDVPFLAEGGRGGQKWTEQLKAERSAALTAA